METINLCTACYDLLSDSLVVCEPVIGVGLLIPLEGIVHVREGIEDALSGSIGVSVGSLDNSLLSLHARDERLQLVLLSFSMGQGSYVDTLGGHDGLSGIVVFLEGSRSSSGFLTETAISGGSGSEAGGNSDSGGEKSESHFVV